MSVRKTLNLVAGVTTHLRILKGIASKAIKRSFATTARKDSQNSETSARSALQILPT